MYYYIFIQFQKKSAEKFFEALEDSYLKDRILIPDHVAFEFFKNKDLKFSNESPFSKIN